MEIYEFVLLIYSNMKPRKVALFLELIVLGAAANITNGSVNTTTLNTATNHVQTTEDHKSYVVDLTRDSFHVRVSRKSHFVMFYDSL